MYFHALKVRVRKAGVKNERSKTLNSNAKLGLLLLSNSDALCFANTGERVGHPTLPKTLFAEHEILVLVCFRIGCSLLRRILLYVTADGLPVGGLPAERFFAAEVSVEGSTVDGRAEQNEQFRILLESPVQGVMATRSGREVLNKRSPLVPLVKELLSTLL
jgi:hypothetical protein